MIILASGLAEVDKELSKILPDTKKCYYREGIMATAENAEVIVISEHLPGKTDFYELLLELRRSNFRIILLPGSIKASIVEQAITLGIYDFVPDPVTPDKIVYRINNPGHLGDMDIDPKTAQKINVPSVYSKKSESNVPEKQKKLKLPSFKLPGLHNKHEYTSDDKIIYAPHKIIAVCNPVNTLLKSLTALNLAVIAAKKGINTVIVNFELSAPVLDKWFGIGPKTQDQFPGLLTLGNDLDTQTVLNMLVKKWETGYLPVGPKIKMPSIPDIPVETLEQTLNVVYERQLNSKAGITIIDMPSSVNCPLAYAVFKKAATVVVPEAGLSQEAEVISDMVAEMTLIGINSVIERVVLNTEYKEMLCMAKNNKPYALVNEENSFEGLLRKILN